LFLRPAKSNQPIAVFFLPLLCLLIWLNPVLPHGEFSFDTATVVMPLYSFILKFAPVFSLSSQIFSCVLVVIIAFMISRLNTKFIFISERTYLPSLLYIVIVGSLVPFKEIYPILPAVVFFLIAFERLLDSYKVESLSYNIFDASFFIGIASLFYFTSIFFILFIWIAMSILRPFHLREWVFSFMGLAVPYILLFSTYYLFDYNQTEIITAIKSYFTTDIPVIVGKSHYIFAGYLGLLILIGSQHIMRVHSAKKILARKSYNLFFYLFILSIAIFVFLKSATIDMVFIGAVPVSIMLAQYFISVRPSRLVESIFDILIVLFLVTQLLRF
jgi:hypothetical protein